MISTGNKVCIEISDGVTKTRKKRRAIEGPCRVVGRTKIPWSSSIGSWMKGLFDRVALAHRPTGVPPKLPESVSVMDIQGTILGDAFWLFQGFLDLCLKDDGRLELLLN